MMKSNIRFNLRSNLKSNVIFGAILTVLFGSVGSAMGKTTSVDQGPKLRTVPVEWVYAPKGFDSNDNSEVVVEGYLPDLCYHTVQSQVNVIGKNIYVDVKAYHRVDTNSFVACAQIIVPFTLPVSLGILSQGDYKIHVNSETRWAQKAELGVAKGGVSRDDFIYAGVEFADIDENGKVATLYGYNPSDCFVLREIKFIDNGKDTYSVLPIMDQIGELCPMKMVPFEYSFKVPTTLTAESILLHVRSMDGNSVNRIFKK